MSQIQRLEVGALVKLKAGGPDMAVKAICKNLAEQETGSVDCQWFAGKKLESGRFPIASLELVTPAKVGA